MLSCNLKLSLHKYKICFQPFRVFQLIKRSVSNLGQKKLDLYKSMIIPILTCTILCNGLSKYKITDLENVRRLIIKSIIPHMDWYKDWLIETSLLPLPMYIKISNLLLLSKISSLKYDADMLDVPSYSSSWRGCIQGMRYKFDRIKDIFQKGRSSLQSTSHGGTSIGVKTALMSEPASYSFNSNGAAVACYIKIDKRKLLVVSCYVQRANSKYALKPDEKNNQFKDINKSRKNCDLFVYGDFSYPSINCCNISSIKETKISFLEEIENLEVHQNVKFNTASAVTLDLIFSSNKIHVSYVHTLDSNVKLGKLSNHYPAEISFNVEISDLMRRKFIKESIFSYCNGDYDLLNEQTLENVFDTYCWSNVNGILNHWYNWLSSPIKKRIPKRTKHRSS